MQNLNSVTTTYPIDQGQLPTVSGIGVADFINALWPDPPEAPHSFGVGSLKDSTWTALKRDVTQAVESQLPATDLYFHVCAHDPKKTGSTGRGNKNSATLMPAIWLDLDIHEKDPDKGYPPREIAIDYLSNSCPLKPSIINDSGSGGFHVYWLLKESEQYNQVLVKGWQEFISKQMGYVVDMTHNSDRLLRVPGTVNTKSGGECYTISIDENLRYDPTDFEDYLTGVLSIRTYPQYTASYTEYTTQAEAKKTYFSPKIIKPENIRGLDIKNNLAAIMDDPRICDLIVKRLFNLSVKGLEKPDDSVKICCVLHEESRPSASLLRCDSGAIVYTDFHLGGKPHSLTAIYAWLHYGKQKRLSRVEFATWAIRVLVDAAIIRPAYVPHKSLPEDSTQETADIYLGFLRLIGCRWLYEQRQPAPFAYDFARAWCEIGSKSTIAKGFKALLKNENLRFCDKHKGTNLYLPLAANKGT